MSDYWYQPPGRSTIRSYYYEANERLPQYEMENVLRAKMATLPNITSLMGRAAKAIEQDEHGVRVTVDDAGWPYEASVLEADYLVGCDGAHSLTREQVGIRQRGADFDQRMLLAVFRSKALHDALDRFPRATTYRVLDPELQGYWMFFGRVDVGQAFFFHAPVPAGRGVQEELGRGFTLIALDASDTVVNAFKRAAEAENIPLKVARDTCDGGREAYASKLILVRPDQDVVWLGNDAPGDERGLLRKVVGRA